MLVLGEKEAGEGKVAVRHRTEGDKGSIPLGQFIEQVRSRIDQKI
jgi:threonyl-tRNA synthetase